MISRKSRTYGAVIHVLACLLPLGCATNNIRIEKDAAKVSVYKAEEAVLRYRYADVPFKSYVEEFCTPAGVNVLRDSPHDHKHHHALMFGVAVDQINFWAEFPDCGKQIHRSFTNLTSDTQQGLRRAVITDLIDWTNTAGDITVLHEQRTIETYQGRDLGASLLSWNSRLELPKGKVSAIMTGSVYFGLGGRFLQSMDVGGAFINADGKTGVKGTNFAKSAWCAYKANADGKPVTVAFFGHPQNLRQPATWFTMTEPFAYISATLNLEKEPINLIREKPVRLRYGVALWDGHADSATIEKLYRMWISLPAAK